MLRELLYRDWMLNRATLLLSLAIFAAFNTYSVIQSSSARVYMVFACIYSAFLAVSVFVREDKFRATGWTCSLPVTRRDVVRARFVGAWIFVASGLTAALLLAALIPGGSIPFAHALDPSTLLIAAAIATVVLALMQPFAIRFGFTGVLIFLVGAQVLGGVALVVVRAVGTSAGGDRPIRDGLARIGEALVASREALTPWPFGMLVVLVLVAVNYLGYRLAVALFVRREL